MMATRCINNRMFQQVPITLIDDPIAVLHGILWFISALQNTAKFGHIGRYYSEESMLLWDEERQR